MKWFTESSIWAWPLVTNLGVYMAGIARGAVITSLMVVFLRLMLFRKGKLFMGISEGAIPFALESPITAIPSYMVGAIVGSTAAVWLGAVQWFPESASWAWPLVTNLGVYMAGLALGAVITALMVVFLRLMMFRKGKLLIDSL